MESPIRPAAGGLKDPGSISEGYVQNRGPGAGGPCYQWTRKVRGKTLSVALSPERINGCVKPSATGGKCNRTSKKCSACRAKFSLPPCPIHHDANALARKF